MGENDNGNGVPQLTDAELNQDISVEEIDPDNATPDQVKDLLTKTKTLAAQKKHWRTNAIDPATGKKYRDLVPPAQQVTPPPQSTEQPGKADERIAKLEQSEEKRTFGHAHNLSPEEVDHVFATSRGLNIKPQEALEKPFVKAGIEAIRKNARIENNTPGPSSRSPVVEGKHFNDMKPEDRKKNFGAVVQQLQRR